MAITTRTPGELVAASKHLQYEIMMLFGTATALGSGVTDVILRNALAESFTIHVRALLAFIYDDKMVDSDVVAGDYVTDWSSKRPQMPASLEKVNRRVNKEVAHLTYDRLSVTEEAKGWDVMFIAREIHQMLRAFVELVPDNLFGPNMVDQKAAILKGRAAI